MLQNRLECNEMYQSRSYPDQPAAIVKEYSKMAVNINSDFHAVVREIESKTLLKFNPEEKM